MLFQNYNEVPIVPEMMFEVEVTSALDEQREEEEPENMQETASEEAQIVGQPSFGQFTGEQREEEEPENVQETASEEAHTVGQPSFGQFTVEALATIPNGIRYYTSLLDYAHFCYVFACLGPAARDLKYKCKKLKPEDQFLLTLIKLRHNKDDQELAFFFGISQGLVSTVFRTWINFLYFQLQELEIWPSREVVDSYIPSDFKAKYPSTRVIIDGTEIPIEKPTNLLHQSATWSNYKNRNTLKVLVGVSPRGDVSHISEAYGGAASDRQVIERSELLADPQKFKLGDSIMADKGFVVQDLFLMRGVHVNIPTVMKGMSQLPPEKVLRDRNIASKRVHVERIIGLAKVFKILKDELHHNYLPIGGRILFVCFSLCNFKPNILKNDA
jgi:hypothetical protein